MNNYRESYKVAFPNKTEYQKRVNQYPNACKNRVEDEEWCGIPGSASDGLFKHNLIPYDFALMESHASAHVNVYKHCKYRPFFLSLYDCSCKTKQVANNNSTGTLIMANQIECHDRNFSEWSSTTPAVAF